MSERIVLVHNPNSTRAERVPHEIFDPLRRGGIDFTFFETQQQDTESNIADMQSVFKDGDTIIVAGGDGTKMQAINAALRSKVDVQLGLEGYGNYNDLSDKKLTALDIANKDYTTTVLRPMTVEVNNDYLFHSPSYLTMGFTAHAAAKFSQEQTRKNIEQLPQSMRMLGNLARLAATYFELHSYKLPPYHTSESPVVRDAVSDILLLNSKRAGGIIRSHPDYGLEDYFGYHEANVANILASLPFGVSALAGHAMADHLTDIQIEFEQPSTVPIQSEGEFRVLNGVSKISVYKNPADRLKILRARN